jgi:uroporphyrin-3 C-methyltransferase
VNDTTRPDSDAHAGSVQTTANLPALADGGVQAVPQARAPGWLKAALLVLGLAATGAGTLAWQTQQRVKALEQELVRRQQDSQAQAVEARVAAKQAQELSREAAARATLLEARVAEVALQRSQVEDLIRSVNLSRDENLVAEIESSLRVATQQASLTGSTEPLLAALQSASERLARVQQAGLDSVKRAVNKDLERLRGTRVADLASLSERLDEAIRLVDDVPLLSMPSQREPTARRPAAQPADTRANPADANQTSWPGRAWLWSQDMAQSVWHETRGLIRLTRIEQPESMLLAPDEAFFLRENTKLRLLNARLALLSRQTATALNDLQGVQNSMPRYFDMQSRRGKRVASLVADVAVQARQTDLPRPDDTLAALAALTARR